MNNDTEIWKDVPGYNGLYEASSMGRIRQVTAGKSTIVDQHWYNKMYRGVRLHDGKTQTRHLVHRLIARTFMGPVPEGKEVHHVDHDPANNAINNLAYVTHAENIRLAHEHHSKPARDTMDTDKKFLTPAEAAEELAVSAKSVRRWIKDPDSDKLRGYKVGGRWRIPISEMERVSPHRQAAA